jgi:hypothetical protein
MIKKICTLLAITLITTMATAFAMIPDSMDISTAEQRSYETLLVNSIEGEKYELFLIADNPKYTEHYLWEKNPLYVGKFYSYIARVGDDYAYLQKNIEPFETVDRDNIHRNGCYVIDSINGMPDIVANIYRASGGGSYGGEFYAIKNNKLQKIQFMKKDRTILKRGFALDVYHESVPAKYLDDGTFYVHWWTNAWPDVGDYKSVYMLDTKNLIMIEAYTYKRGPHDDDYHEI